MNLKGQQNYAAPLMGIIIFILIFTYILAEVTHSQITFLNPISLISVITLFVIAIGAGNTPVARGVAVAAAVGILMSSFFIDFVKLGLPIQLFSFIIVPFLIVFLFIFLETSKG